MSYRGEDLDLRLPSGWQGQGGNAQRGEFRSLETEGYGSPAQGLGSPIYVDDTLLACCNHAYDVALAHRAGEVRIEHLLYALTRIDAAAEVLETNGIRDAGLRRETATIIASEIPIGLSNGTATPQRSAAFEEALRLAAAHAYRRKAAAGVADLLHVFFDVKPDLPGLDILRRHAPAIGLERQQSGSREPQPPFLTPPTYFAEIPREPAYQPVAYPAYPAPSPQPRTPVAPRSDILPTAQDSIQNSRLDALEKMIRTVGDDLSSERKMFSGVLGDMQRDLSAQRGVPDGVVERLNAVEQSLRSRDSEIARQLAGISERLAEIDNLSGGAGLGAGEAGKIISRLDVIERSMREREGETGESLASVSERMKALERAINMQPEAVVDMTPLEGRLSDIETALLSVDGGGAVRDPQLEAQIEERLEALEQALATRLGAIEQRLSADRAADTDTAAAVQAELKALASVVTTNANGAERIAANLQERLQEIGTVGQQSHSALAQVTGFVGPLGDRLSQLEVQSRQALQETAAARSDFVNELSDVHDAIMKLNANQHALAESIESTRKEEVTALGAVTHRLAALESGLNMPQEELNRLSGNLDKMYRVQIERYHRRNRFWFWLFGTDDWIGASWPSQTARVENELRALKRAGEDD